MKLALTVALLFAASPLAAQTSQQQPLGAGGQISNSSLPNTGGSSDGPREPTGMTKQQRADLRGEIEALRAMLNTELADIRARLDVLERPKIARVVIDPSRSQEPGGGTAR
jgi:hypothetical protein